jgi:hypothetical protein
VKPTGIVGAEDITASPDAIHIGNPVEVTKLRGKPKVSSGGTIGHTSRSRHRSKSPRAARSSTRSSGTT